MFEQEIQRKIGDFRELGLPSYIPRESSVHIVKNTISTLVGARRAGKSFRAMQVADELMKKGGISSINQICPLDFDNPVLSGMKAQDIQLIASTFLKITPELKLNTPVVFILDEIHKIEKWEEAVIDLSKNPNWIVIVTGSSSKLLQKEIATELRGKTISSTVYPLSFREFLKFKGFKSSSSTRSVAEIKRYFDEYLKWGGYPAVVNIDDYSREALLREYFQTMILKDIIQRYDISKPNTCIKLCHYLMSAISRPMTHKSMYEYLMENNFTTSRDAVRDYVRMMEDSWFLFLVPLFSKSHKEQERNYKKIYCIDWALAQQNSPIWDGSYSRSFENMIYLHLLAHYSRVHFYLTKTKRQEVDFLAINHRGQIELAVQVCMDLTRKETLKREVEPLIHTAKYFGIKENIIITLDQEKKFREDGVSIAVVPAWKWLAL